MISQNCLTSTKEKNLCPIEVESHCLAETEENDTESKLIIIFMSTNARHVIMKPVCNK